MIKIKKNELGFSTIELVLVVVVVALIGAVGWMVYKNHKVVVATPSTNAVTSVNTAKPSVVEKQYVNSEYGFSFSYPSTWTLKEDLNDIGRGHLEGNITVTSPSSTVVTFNANQGGKGGDCWDDQANARTTRTCMTAEFLKVDKITTNSSGKSLYFYQVKVTPSTEQGGSVQYSVGMLDDSNGIPVVGSGLTPAFVDIVSAKGGDVNISVSGKDDHSDSSASFFNTNEVREATLILKTFQLQ